MYEPMSSAGTLFRLKVIPVMGHHSSSIPSITQIVFSSYSLLGSKVVGEHILYPSGHLPVIGSGLIAFKKLVPLLLPHILLPFRLD